MKHKVAILNCAILTNPGVYEYEDTTVTACQHLIKAGGVDSAIGHASTAQILTEVLGVEIPVNRQQFSQQVDQHAVVFAMNKRGEEGKIYNKEEIEAIGYTLRLLSRVS